MVAKVVGVDVVGLVVVVIEDAMVERVVDQIRL